MAQASSNAFRVEIVAAPAWTPPYSLPSAGQVVAIGTNFASSVAPPGWTAGAVDYSTFGSYGGGAFVPDYSAGGAWVAAGFGGHNHPDHVGAFVFDFADATWKRLDNANGVALQSTYPHSYPLARSNGTPYFELDGTQVPSPPHPYGNLLYLPVGTKGSVAYVGRAAMGTESNVATTAVHRFDLATRLWSRMTNNTSTRTMGYEADSVRDAPRNRVWVVMQEEQNYQSRLYLDLADMTYKTTASGPWPSSDLAQGGRAFVYGGLLFRQVNNGTLYYFDPDNAAAGWGQCNLSSALPNAANRLVEWNGKFWGRGNGSGNTLTRVTPPANLKTGTWAVASVSVTGPTMAAKWDGGTTNHYSNLVSVPAINCLAWVPGGSSSVYLIRPE